jgi:hypothetical protein
MPEPRYEKNVFHNCPFDEEYVELLRPILFTLLYLVPERKPRNRVFQFYQKTLNGLKLLCFESQISNPKSKIVPEQGFRSGTT